MSLRVEVRPGLLAKRQSLMMLQKLEPTNLALCIWVVYPKVTFISVGINYLEGRGTSSLSFVFLLLILSF